MYYQKREKERNRHIAYIIDRKKTRLNQDCRFRIGNSAHVFKQYLYEEGAQICYRKSLEKVSGKTLLLGKRTGEKQTRCLQD